MARLTNYIDSTSTAVDFTSVIKHIVKAGEALNKGDAVYVFSADGTNIIVKKASNSSEATSSKTLGIMQQSLPLNGQGYVIAEGLLEGLDTNSANAGDPVWLGVNGQMIFGLLGKPSAPNHLVYLGVVTRKQQNNGEIFVKVQNGYELEELHNVKITDPQNNDVLKYNSSLGLWINSQP